RLVILRERQLPGYPEFGLSPPNYADWEARLTSFEHVAGYRATPLSFTGADEPQRVAGVRVTAHYFDVFGIKPALGRAFRTEDDAPGHDKVVVLSQPFWQRIFGGATDAVGRTIQLNGEPYTVIGVAPAGFGAADNVE